MLSHALGSPSKLHSATHLLVVHSFDFKVVEMQKPSSASSRPPTCVAIHHPLILMSPCNSDESGESLYTWCS